MNSEETSIQHYDVKSEEKRRKIFHNWPVEYLDVVCYAFCHVRLGQWKEEDNPFQEHKCWSVACAFINWLFVGNIPVGSYNEQYGHIRDVCGSSRGTYLYLYLFCYMCVLYCFPH